VADRSAGDGTERTLRLDALIHNRCDPDRPDFLRYEYERIFEALTRNKVGSGAAAAGLGFSTLTLGGGGFTLPAYLERHYPAARNEVAEIDPDVVETAHRFFGLPRDTRIRIAIADARTYVDTILERQKKCASSRRGGFDIVYCDAFNAFSVPSHLTTREFTAKVGDILAPDGLYLANCIDIFDSGRFLNAYLNTLKAVFPRVSVYMPPSCEWGQRLTFVVAAGRQAPDADTLRGPDGAIVGSKIPQEKIIELRARNGGLVLTDDHAPVETLMAPVFLRSVK
jgi:predicted membrane-bound spermidine synthase